MDNFEEKMLDDLETEASEDNNYEELPCVPLRGLTIFPGTVVSFDIGREKSKNALDIAMAGSKYLFVASQLDDDIMLPTSNDYYHVGTVVKVKQMLKIQGDSVRVLVDGKYRARVVSIDHEEPYIAVKVERLFDAFNEDKALELEALMRLTIDSYKTYVSLTDEKIGKQVVEAVCSIEEPGALADSIATQMKIKVSDKQEVLEALDISQRLELLNNSIIEENQILKIEKKISAKVKESLDKNQKEYVLKEQMKAIQDELGGTEDIGQESQNWLEQLDALKLPEKTDDKIRKEIKKFAKMQPMSAESTVSRTYIETVLALPWNKESKASVNLKRAEKILNEDHYGLEKVKERILEYLAVVHLSKGIKGPIICLVGPPGVGKTSVAKSIARATGREFVRMSLGGVRDEAEIRGHRKTYIGAMPGRIINQIKEAGTCNPVFLFDEIDKIGADYKGDPASALLEVLDPEQNKDFTDHFLEVPFDLSKVMFITTANSTDTIPRPLMDRMEIIYVPGYTEQEKVIIARKYLIPKKVKEHGLKKTSLNISDRTISDIINFYTRESGVRNLEREIANICRKVARKVVAKSNTSVKLSPSNLEKYLGKKKFKYDVVLGKNEVGVTTGMAWTQVGGDTLFIEAVIVPGSGKVVLTGQLGDVMQESAKAAISYIRSISSTLELEEDFYKKYDLHVHVPEGATPKDGPSAGVTMCTSIVSAFTGYPVKRDVAMTGEITLRGRVLPIGGVREKVLAAHRAGISTILLPEDNMKDIDEIPASVRKQLKFIPLVTVEDALREAIVR